MIDIGANVGHISTWAANMNGKFVLSVEPHPANLNVLYKRIADLNLTAKIQVFPYAMSFAYEKLQMNLEFNNNFFLQLTFQNIGQMQ